MGVSKLFTAYAMAVDTDILGGITQETLSTGFEVQRDLVSGSIYPRHQSVTAIKPSGGFTTKHIARALGLIGLTGLNIGGLGTGLGMFAYQKQGGGSRYVGASHRKYTVRDGLVFPRRLSITHQGDATLNYVVAIIFDGSNAPILYTDSVALPAETVTPERFTIGPLFLGGLGQLTQIQNIDLDFGLTVNPAGADSEVYDTFVSLDESTPELTVRATQPEWFGDSAVPLEGLACTHANTRLFLRKRQRDSTFHANNEAEHVKLTLNGLAYIEDPIDAAGTGDAEITLRLPLSHDGTTVPLVATVGQAIA